MNKQLIIKWCKRVGIAIASAVTILLLYVLSYYIHEEYYIPHRIESLYQEGLENPDKAENNIKQLLKENGEDPETKALNLMKFYANKKELWAQTMLEKYNEEHNITLNSNIPINKHIWGITLSRSTKRNVYNYLDSKGLWYQDYSNENYIQSQSDFEFAGVYWNCIDYYFINNRVSAIVFRCRGKESKLEEYYYKLRNMITKKYTISKITKSSKDNEYQPQFSIKDTHTLIQIKLYYYSDNSSKEELYFKYTDLIAEKKKEAYNIDDI